MSEKIPFRVRPMLASLVDEPFHKPGWVYEEKYDGYRILAYKEDDHVTLLSRNSKDRTHTFALVAKSIQALPARTLLLDGEAVVFDRKGISHFQSLQDSHGGTVFAAFDCLYLNGQDLRHKPLLQRREALENAIGSTESLFPSRRLASNGLEAYKIAKRRKAEGIVAKNESSLYTEMRSRDWLKVKVIQEEEFVIAGYTSPSGARKYFGALLLGAYQGGELHYAGKVGTGFTSQSLARLHHAFRRLVRERPALVDPPREKNVTYLAPRLVAQVTFFEWTEDRKLRHPVFLGLRDDIAPEDCGFSPARRYR